MPPFGVVVETIKLKNSYAFYALLTILFWGLGNVLTRVALRDFSPFALGFLRYIIASAVMLAAASYKKLALPRKEDLHLFALSGFFGFAFYMVSYNMGYIDVTAATGSVISATVPLITAALARIFYRERLCAGQWVAVLVQFFGILVISFGAGGFSVSKGVAWLLLSTLSLSIYNLLQRRLTQSYTALEATVFSIFFGTLMLSAFSFEAFGQLGSAGAPALVCVLYLGVFTSAAAFLCWTKAFSLAEKASEVSNFMFITPLVSIAFEILLLKDIPPVQTITGGVVILFGAALFYTAKSKTNR